MDIIKIVDQTKDLIINPKGTLKKLKNKKVNRNDIIIYLAVVGFPTFLGIFIGLGIYGFWAQAFVRAIVFYILAIGGILFFGYIYNEFAPNFKSKKNLMQSVKLIAYSSTPWLLAGILWIVPLNGIWVLSFLAGLYGVYILYLGLPIYLETPNDQQAPYLLFGIILMAIVMAITAYLSRIIWLSTFRGPF